MAFDRMSRRAAVFGMILAALWPWRAIAREPDYVASAVEFAPGSE